MDGVHQPLSNEPELSVVLVAPSGLPPLRRTLASLAAQTCAARIELVVVAADAEVLQTAGPLLEPFHSVRVLPVGQIPNVDHAAAQGLLAARAPIVASIEDHAYPEPEWASRLLEMWEPGCVAVGSAMLNANPDSALSWSNMLIAYGGWGENAAAGPAQRVPLHNGSYRRAALEAHAAELPRLFNRESEILRRLQADGGAFRFAPQARIRHLNPSSLAATARLRIDAGRLSAAGRVREEGWGMVRRLAYAVLAPAIPLVRYARMRREMFGPGRHGEARLGPALMIGLVLDALGQMLGFVAGPGGTRARLATFEMDRMRHLGTRDLKIFRPMA